VLQDFGGITCSAFLQEAHNLSTVAQVTTKQQYNTAHIKYLFVIGSVYVRYWHKLYYFTDAQP